jgi:type I restriction enzyme, S subunit
MGKTPKDWGIRELGEVAIVQTGLAKGKKNIKDPISLPYLRVANVQDGYLDLSEVKTIDVSRAEIERYRLKPNDVLLTEGGDFDKLGRGYEGFRFSV